MFYFTYKSLSPKLNQLKWAIKWKIKMAIRLSTNRHLQFLLVDLSGPTTTTRILDGALSLGWPAWNKLDFIWFDLYKDADRLVEFNVALDVVYRVSSETIHPATVQPVLRWRQSLSCCWSPGLEQSATGGHISAITGHLSQASEDSSVHRVIFHIRTYNYRNWLTSVSGPCSKSLLRPL